MCTINELSCPACGAMCSLTLGDGFITSSLPVKHQLGFRLVAAAIRIPRMLCDVCDLDIIGIYDDDNSEYVHFLYVPPSRPQYVLTVKTTLR